jgi:acyl carrier protein
MKKVSRRPEGLPAQCPVCAAIICLEPSGPEGDAPCPYCGEMLWFLRVANSIRYYPRNELSPETRQRFTAFLARWFHHKDAEEGVTWLDSLALDSLDVAEFLTELEGTFHVRIPELEARRWRSAGDLIDYVVQKYLN